MAMSAATKLGPKGDMRLMENRNGLAVGVLSLRPPDGRSGRLRWTCFPVCGRGCITLWGDRTSSITLGGDKNYDTGGFVAKCREMKVTPHGAQNTKGRASDIDGRTTRHPGYAISQRVRKRVEEIFGWTKTVDGGRKLRYIGVARNQMWADLAAFRSSSVSYQPGMPQLPRPCQRFSNGFEPIHLIRMTKLAPNPG